MSDASAIIDVHVFFPVSPTNRDYHCDPSNFFVILMCFSIMTARSRLSFPKKHPDLVPIVWTVMIFG